MIIRTRRNQAPIRNLRNNDGASEFVPRQRSSGASGAENGAVRVLSSGPTMKDDAFFSGLLLHRMSWFRQIIDWKHDIDRECGYPEEFEPWQYRRLYDREAIARRVVNIYPEECWAMDPEVSETEDKKETGFEEDVAEIVQRYNLWSYCERINRLSRIGSYGLLLLGTNDMDNLARPLRGIDEYGYPTGKPDPDLELRYFRAFDQTQCWITNYQQEKRNPRYGHPTYYNLRFTDLNSGIPEAQLVGGNYFRRVHWSRVVHIADQRESGEVFGTPAMRPVLNRLLDLRKLLAGSAEMFWKGAFPGLSFEMDPDIAQEPDFDEKKFHDKAEAYSQGLSRYLAVLGGKIKSLVPQVADPSHFIMEQLNAIAIGLGCPLRLFMGSEEAKLASSTDKRTWNERLHRYQVKYLSPFLVRPILDRLCAVGLCTPPKKQGRYHITWPDLNKPTDQDKANLAITRTQAIVQYVAADAAQLVAPMEFLTKFLDFPETEAEIILKSSATFNKGRPLPAPAPTPTPTSGKSNPSKNGKKGKTATKGIQGTGKGSKAQAAVDASRSVARGISKAVGGDAI